MFELKLCGICAAVKCNCSQILKGCADCDTYTPAASLIEKSDGREVCPKCQGKIERETQNKQQPGFFDQASLFS